MLILPSTLALSRGGLSVPTPPLPALPTGFLWPSQINPVTYDRSKLIVWGDRWEGADPEKYDLATWRMTTPRNPWNFRSSNNNRLTFEVRNGDLYSEDGFTDDEGIERSEVQAADLVPNTWNWSLGFKSMLEGMQNTAPWAVLMQAFARNGGAGMGSPPFALTLEEDDTVHLITRTGSSGSPVESYRTSFQASRSSLQDLWLEGKWSTTGDGFARIYLNGSTLLEAENISMGYTGQTHWEFCLGAYRNTAPEPLIHHIEDLSVSW